MARFGRPMRSFETFHMAGIYWYRYDENEGEENRPGGSVVMMADPMGCEATLPRGVACREGCAYIPSSAHKAIVWKKSC